jgi:DNA invertase Pin-like site-specific DNA recombinase
MEAEPRTRAVIYLRASEDPTGERLAVQRHHEACQRLCDERGWQVVAVYEDNSIGAYKKTVKRPGYERMLAAYEAGQFEALVCWDLDRLTRQPRQLEDWIDAAEERGLAIVTANGEADLTTDGGRMYARIKASVARAESERKSARQKLAAVQRAENGKPPLGVRLSGYGPDGAVIEHEAAVVRAMFERFHAGDSLRGVVSWLTEQGTRTRHGGPWNPSSVRDILLNPRYAGRAIYNGQPNGHDGSWEPIVETWLYDDVASKLADPRRRCQVGTDRKYIGSGLYLCAVCDRPVVSQTHSPAGKPSVIRYRCAGHIVRSGASIDRYVLEILRERLGRPDLAALLTEPGNEQAAKATAEIKRLRGRLGRIEADYDAELIDGRRYKISTEKTRALLGAAEAAQARLMAGSEVAGTLRAPDPVAAFDASVLGIQRQVLAFFMTVKLAPAPRGHHFDTDTVIILPRTPDRTTLSDRS